MAQKLRSIYGIGDSTLAITIPRGEVLKNNLKKGDLVKVKVRSNLIEIQKVEV